MSTCVYICAQEVFWETSSEEEEEEEGKGKDGEQGKGEFTSTM